MKKDVPLNHASKMIIPL